MPHKDVFVGRGPLAIESRDHDTRQHIRDGGASEQQQHESSDVNFSYLDQMAETERKPIASRFQPLMALMATVRFIRSCSLNWLLSHS